MIKENAGNLLQPETNPKPKILIKQNSASNRESDEEYVISFWK